MPTFRPDQIAVLTVAALMVGCISSSQHDHTTTSQTGIVTIYTVNYPLKYFADRIGGEQVKVVFPAPPDEDPAFWRPDAATVAAYQQADLILLNGATYAKWVPTVTLPESKLVNTSRAVQDKYITVQDAVTHRHGPGEAHSHAGIAFTTWLDPEIAMAQADAIRQALSKLRPEHQEAFDRGFESLKADLEAFDDQLAAAVGQAPQRPIIFSHPVYQYLTRKYGLQAKSLHWEPDTLPDDAQWTALATMRDAHPATWMIWEAEPLEASVKRLSELGVRSVVFEPCGNTPEDGDWLQVMRRNVESLARVFAAEPTD